LSNSQTLSSPSLPLNPSWLYIVIPLAIVIAVAIAYERKHQIRYRGLVEKCIVETLPPETRRDRVSHHVLFDLATPSDPSPGNNRIFLAHLPLVWSGLLHSTSQGAQHPHWLRPGLLRCSFRKGVCGRLQGYRQDPDENSRGRNKRKDNYYETHRSRP